MACVGDIKIQRHLSSGDPEPALDQERFTLFGFGFCPFTERVQLVLNHHKIDYDLVLVALASKPDWFLKLSPSGSVPLLYNRGDKLHESDLIMRFVDQLHGPEASLMSVCGEETFYVAVELAGKLSAACHSILFNQTYPPETVDQFNSSCEAIQSALHGKYLAGDELSLADLVIFPMLDRFEVTRARIDGHPAVQQVTEMIAEPNNDDPLALLKGYIWRMRHDQPVIQMTRKPSRAHALFIHSFLEGQPNPDIMFSHPT